MARVSAAVMVVAVAAVLGVAMAVNPAQPDVEFALKFISTPVDGINHATATSEMLTTTVTKSGVTFTVGDFTKDAGVMWLSKTNAQDGSTWSEVGNITFPSGDAILFRSFGLSGHIKNGPTTGSSYGGISYDIYDGTGAYKGADGVMVDTFIGPAGATSFPINGWGFFWLPNGKPAHHQ